VFVGPIPAVFRTATPVRNRGERWQLAAFSEFAAGFLNVMQRSVNRKVRVRIPAPEPKL